MTDKCPKCGAGWTRKPYSRKGWKFCDCGRRWHPVHGWEAYDNTCCLSRQLSAANAIIDRLPKTADGVSVVYGDTVYAWVDTRREVRPFVVHNAVMAWANAGGWVLLINCHSTIEAALAARKETK